MPIYQVTFSRYRLFNRGELVALGVASTLADTARRILERSADQAGFYESGRDRLVMPGFVPQAEKGGTNLEKPGSGSGGGGTGDGTELDLDPLLIALLKKIPPTGEWPAAQRLRWFRTFAMNVSQIYDKDEAPVEMKIDLDPVAGR